MNDFLRGNYIQWHSLCLALVNGRVKPSIINQVLFSVSAHYLFLHGIYLDRDSSVTPFLQNDKKKDSE
jgi:hypothetical protein